MAVNLFVGEGVLAPLAVEPSVPGQKPQVFRGIPAESGDFQKKKYAEQLVCTAARHVRVERGRPPEKLIQGEQS